MVLSRIVSQRLWNDHWSNFLPSFPSRTSVKQETYPFGNDIDIVDFDLSSIDILDSNLIEAVNFRYSEKPILSIDTVFREPDFLDFSFLEKGIVCGRAICRLLRKTNDSNAQALFKILKQSNQERRNTKKGSFTRAELSEIFSIKADDQPSFFKDLPEDLSYSAFEDFKKVEQVLPFIPAGTASLVGDAYLLTCNHVLDDQERLNPNNIFAEFNYEKKIDGIEENTPFSISVDKVLATDENLDYALLRLSSNSQVVKNNHSLHYLSLSRSQNLIAPPLTFDRAEKLNSELHPEVKKRIARAKMLATALAPATSNPSIRGIDGEPVTIIQHPRGKHKQIVLSNNRVIGMANNFLYYEADTEHGSSGSLVFNQQWQPVALHRAYIAEDDTVVGYEGTRIYTIIHDLEIKSNNPSDENRHEIQRFINEFVDQPLPWSR